MQFSIIIPVYNVERYLVECLDSIKNQTHTEFECILVDDGATDESGKICDDYANADKRFRVIHQGNGGAASARKKGLSAAVGDFIYCVDSDDFLELDALEEAHKIIEEYPGLDIVCFGMNDFHEGKKTLFAKCDDVGYLHGDSLKAVFEKLLRDENGEYFSWSLANKIIRKELFLQHQNSIDDRIRIGEDMCVSVSCVFYANAVYVIDKPLYNYRRNSSSVSKKRTEGFPWEDVELRAEYFKKVLPLEKHHFYEQLCRSTVHSLFSVAASHLQTKKPYKQVKKDILEHLSKPIYKEYIKNCKFKNFADKVALFSIKHKMVWLMKIYASM